MRWWRVLVLCAAVVGCCCAGSVQAEEAGPLVFRLYVPQYHIQPAPKLGVSGASTAQVEALGGSWVYWWGPTGHGTSDVEFVPMVWGPNNIGAEVPQEARWLLGFNEPDLQDDLDPRMADGAGLWRDVERLYPDKMLVSPAPSHLDPGWLKRMRADYILRYGEPPRFDALAAHSYHGTADEIIADLRIYLDWADEWCVHQVWLTEFAILPGWNPAWQYELEKLLRWLEAEPRITRYSPFVGYLEIPHWSWPTDDQRLNPSLFTAAGGVVLTDVGRVYADR